MRGEVGKVSVSLYSLVLFACALVMVYMGSLHYRAGQTGRAAFVFFMAISMAIFGWGFL
jgi:hypothetical protein